MSRRDDPGFSREFLILNAQETKLFFTREKQIIAEYKKIFREKEAIEKNLDVLVRKKIKGPFTILQIQSTRRKLDEIKQQLYSIENSSAMCNFIEREEKRREKEIIEEEKAYEVQKAKEAEKTLLEKPVVAHNDEYYDKLWRSNQNEFWNQVKLEWRAKNPGKTQTLTGLLFEKRCDYLASVLSIASIWSIVKMRKELRLTKEENVDTMSIFDVIDLHDYYFPMII